MIATCTLCQTMIDGGTGGLIPNSDRSRAETDAIEYGLLADQLNLHFMGSHPDVVDLNAAMIVAAGVVTSKYFVSANDAFEKIRGMMAAAFLAELQRQPRPQPPPPLVIAP